MEAVKLFNQEVRIILVISKKANKFKVGYSWYNIHFLRVAHGSI